MTLEQVVLTMINDKMLDNGQISEKLHSSIQKNISSSLFMAAVSDAIKEKMFF